MQEGKMLKTPDMEDMAGVTRVNTKRYCSVAQKRERFECCRNWSQAVMARA